MRFSKRVKLGKGLNLNLSKSGVGFSIGGPGASLSFGKRGIYMNTGIPGTGLSHRQKLGSSSRNPSYPTSSTQQFIEAEIKFYVEMDDKNIPLIKWGTDGKLPNGLLMKKDAIIEDNSILRQIKISDAYKRLLKLAAEEKAELINHKTNVLVNIYKQSPRIVDISDIKKEIERISSPAYVSELTASNKPKMDEFQEKLEQEAKQKINSILFWTNRNKRQEYVKKRLNEQYSAALLKWETKTQTIKDDLKRIAENLSLSIDGDENYIVESVQSTLENIELPVDFFADFEYQSETKLIKIDLDLPEIEDLPTEKANATASSLVSIKKKSQKQLKEEYARCVTGLAFYIASNMFNISPVIEKVQISGYTQRLSKKTGQIEDQYIYSIIFDRPTLKKLNVEKIDPIEAFNNFMHNLNKTASYELKTVEPFI